MLASARLPVTRPRCVSLAVLLWLPGIILLVPKEELAGVSLQVLILGPLSVSALWTRKHPDTKCRDGWRASVLYLDSLGYCCRFCAKQIKDYKQPGRVVLKRPWTTLKPNRAYLLCCFKLCALFHSHHWIQTGVTVRKRRIQVKIGNFLSPVTLKFDGWPWTRDLIAATGLVILLKLDSNHRFFSPCDL